MYSKLMAHCSQAASMCSSTEFLESYDGPHPISERLNELDRFMVNYS